MVRSRPAQMEAAAEAGLANALRSLGADLRVGEAGGHTVVITTPDGRQVTAQVRSASIVTPAMAREWARRAGGSDRLLIVVADLVAEGAKGILRDAGYGWLDRRGHLRMAAPGLWLDARVAPLPRNSVPGPLAQQIRGASGIAAAAGALLWPDQPMGVRELARRVGLSATAISVARRRLTEAGLLSTDGHPAVPELFWSLASAWSVAYVPLARIPEPDIAASLVATGTRAALSLGAPVVTRADHPVDLWTMDERAYHRVRLRAGDSPAVGAPARLGIAPTPLALDPALIGPVTVEGWPTTHPLFVALELAGDPGRGAETLESWSPEGFPRVW